MATFNTDRSIYYGRDDGVVCDCGGPTFLVDDQGRGLCSYECEACGDVFGVQYDSIDDDPADYDQLGPFDPGSFDWTDFD